MKKILSVLLSFAIILSITACNNSSSSSQISSSDLSVTETTNNALASKELVMKYIKENYGTAIISGQQESTWMGSVDYEMDYINDNTGKLPAIRGLDYMNDDFEGVNERAIKWWNEGGIVTICWHCGSDFSKSWDECMKTEIADWDKTLTEGTKEYDAFIKGMDKAAEALVELRDAGVPVLWRPFHELDGGWFWWSKGGAANFQKLWKLMYDRYTNYWKLDNLIWVFGYSHNNKNIADWYVGDEYVDIVGADSYTNGANANLFNSVKKLVGDEIPVCFHECGVNPTVEQLQSSNAGWSYFMTWHTEYITDKNDKTALKELYNSDYVITRDELPSFKAA